MFFREKGKTFILFYYSTHLTYIFKKSIIWIGQLWTFGMLIHLSWTLHQTYTNVNRCHAHRSKANIHFECNPEAALSFQQGKNPLYSCKPICHQNISNLPWIWTPQMKTYMRLYLNRWRPKSCSSARGNAKHERITHIKKFFTRFTPGIMPVSTNMTVNTLFFTQKRV